MTFETEARDVSAPLATHADFVVFFVGTAFASVFLITAPGPNQCDLDKKIANRECFCMPLWSALCTMHATIAEAS